MAKGYLIPVLHCHLPYVRHPEHDDFLEEDWFYEAVAETYVPLLLMLKRLQAEGSRFRLTLSISPTLCEMMCNELLRARCVRYLERHVELAQKEVARTRGTPFARAAEMYLERYRCVHSAYVGRYERDIVGPFRELARSGHIELIGSAATHALLPLLGEEQGKAAQVRVGLGSFRKHFGRAPEGFWLPECAYESGLEALLAQNGIRYFFVDTHGVLLAEPQPPFGVFAPLRTPAGPYAFGRDVESSRQVWSADEGYPGDPLYREFYRDLGHDAQLDYLRPYLHADGVRRNLGLKYHRITGNVPLDRKEPYDPAAAHRRAVQHADAFVRERAAQAARVRRATGAVPVIVCPYDAELFGHWWFEGIWFLERVLRQVDRTRDLECVTPGEWLSEYLPEGHARQSGQPAFSSWGYRGYLDVWVNGSNDWMYPRLHAAESAMIRASAHFASTDGLVRRALNQCARQLLLAQASDWAFLVSTGTASHYARRRFNQLMDRFDVLLAQAEGGAVQPDVLRQYESLDDAFPELDHTVFCAADAGD